MTSIDEHKRKIKEHLEGIVDIPLFGGCLTFEATGSRGTDNNSREIYTSLSFVKRF